MPFDPAERLIRYHAAINALDFGTIESCFAEDAVYASAGVGGLSGRGAIVAAFRRYFARYPDQVATDETVDIISPSSACARWHLSATDTQTGDRSARSGTETVTFDAEGRIIRVDVSDD